MNKTYQPSIVDNANKIVSVLEETGFFKEYDITSTDYAKEVICNKLTEKFINGQLGDDEFFTEKEFELFLKDIVSRHLVDCLIEKGLIFSYEDDQTEEILHLTEKGKSVGEFLCKRDIKTD